MKTLTKAQPGRFFCEGHLEDLPVSQQSLDPRYCQGCCRFLEHEASLLSPDRWGKPSWVPCKKPLNQNLGEKTPDGMGYYPSLGEKAKQLDLFPEIQVGKKTNERNR